MPDIVPSGQNVVAGFAPTPSEKKDPPKYDPQPARFAESNSSNAGKIFPGFVARRNAEEFGARNLL